MELPPVTEKVVRTGLMVSAEHTDWCFWQHFAQAGPQQS
jgi:hypothetical protein